MAPLKSSNIPLMTFLLYCLSLLLVLFSYYPEKNLASQNHFLTVDIGSLSPASDCSRTGFNRAGKYSTTLELVHRFGPCSLDEHSTENKPSLADMLSNDQSRVDYIRARSKPNNVIPVQSGLPLDYGDYVVTVGLGTPQQNVTLVLDTSSPLTWTQCKPCTGHCYRQWGPVYDPHSSSSYLSVSCGSSQCSDLGYDIYCYAGPCVYSITYYSDHSYSVGIVSKDRLTITPTADGLFPDFIFGCGQKNIGDFGKTAGILGLGPDTNNGSFLYQTAQKYGLLFSYCLPSTTSSTGHLTLGTDYNKQYPPQKLEFTPLKLGRYEYLIEIVAISVGGTQLPISPSVFTNTLNIIDSGTVITRLPMDAYVALRDAFKQKMGDSYPAAPAVDFLDTCFYLSNQKKITIPGISFTFQGGATVDLGFGGIVFPVASNETVSVWCLAFAGNTDPGDYLIFGNTQQKTLEVVYDVAGLKLGFGPNGCK